MRKLLMIFAVCVFAASLLSAEVLQVPESNPASLSQQFGYAYGYYLMYQLMQNYPDIDTRYFLRGISDYYTENGNGLYNWSQINQIFLSYQTYLVEANAEAIKKLSEANLKAAEEFLTKNAKEEGVKTTASGLQYTVIREGEGEKPVMTDTVTVDYQLVLLDGTVMDSSYARGSAASFPLNGVIEGFAEALTLMTPGSHYRFWIHPDLGYGSSGSSSIEPNTLLIFDIELYSIAD